MKPDLIEEARRRNKVVDLDALNLDLAPLRIACPSGEISVELLIFGDQRGVVRTAQIVGSNPPNERAEDVAADCARTWSFEPVVIDGEAVRWKKRITVRVPPPAGGIPTDIKALGVIPVALFQPQPIYPPIARAVNLKGFVIVKMVVDESGSVASVRVIRSQPPFDDPAVKAVKNWRYQPVVIGGRGVVWSATITLNFKLASPNRGVDLIEAYLRAAAEEGDDARKEALRKARTWWSDSVHAATAPEITTELDRAEAILSGRAGDAPESALRLEEHPIQPLVPIPPWPKDAIGVAPVVAEVEVATDAEGFVTTARLLAPIDDRFKRLALATASLARFAPTPAAMDEPPSPFRTTLHIRFDPPPIATPQPE